MSNPYSNFLPPGAAIPPPDAGPVQQDWQQRARRAERIAGGLAGVLQRLYDSMQLDGTDSPNGTAAAAALRGWAQYQADLAALDAWAEHRRQLAEQGAA